MQLLSAFLTTCCFWLLVIRLPNLLYTCMSVCACLSPLDIKFMSWLWELSGGHQHHALISILKWWYNQQCGPDSGRSHAPNGRPRFVYQSISGDSAHPITEYALTNVTSQEELDPSLCSGFMCGLRDPASIIIISYMQNKLLKQMERPCGSPWSQAIQL